MKKIFLRKEPGIPFTKEGYQNVLDERKRLLAERPSAVENLRKAREMGDLSENGYYKAAKARLSFLDAQIRRIERLVRCGVVVTSSGSGTVEIGNTVHLTDGVKEYSYTIVGGYESNPSKNTISHMSPLGRALIGKHAGDKVEVYAPQGTRTFTIREVQS
jgi:transcription elongation factor GreA